MARRINRCDSLFVNKAIGILTFKTGHTTTILAQPPQHDVQHRIALEMLHGRQIVVQNEKVFLVGIADFLLQLPAFYRRGEINFTRCQSSQHYRGNRKVHGLPDVRFTVLVRAPAIQNDNIFGFVPKER